MAEARKALGLGCIALSALTLSALAGLGIQQIASITLFSSMLGGVILFWKHRLPITLIGVSLMLALGLIDVPHLVEFASVDIILFLASMMIVIGFLEERGFFGCLVESIMARTGGSAKSLLVALMIASGAFAALVGVVISTLFMVPPALYIATKCGLSPLPLVVMLVFAANIGSCATVVGNPVGIIVAMKGGFTFFDFLEWVTPISMLGLVLAIGVCLLLFRGYISELDAKLKKEALKAEAGRPGKGLATCWIVFLGTVAGIVLHHQIEELLGLERNSMLIGVPLISASLVLLIERERARELVEHRIDWWTLIFFMMLFASVGSLEYVGLTGLIAKAIAGVPASRALLLALFVVLVGALSAFLDNVLAVAALAPVVKELGACGIDPTPFWWALLIGGTFFGNLTLIGSTANMIAVGMLERRRLKHITFYEWLKYGAVVTIPTVAVATILLILRAGLI